MKKIFFVLTLMFAFSINAAAQEKKASYQETATKESKELAELIGLNENQTTDMYRLFEMKNQTFEIKDLSIERKEAMSNIIDMKIKASITAEQIKKLEANQEFYNRLIGKVEVKK